MIFTSLNAINLVLVLGFGIACGAEDYEDSLDSVNSLKIRDPGEDLVDERDQGIVLQEEQFPTGNQETDLEDGIEDEVMVELQKYIEDAMKEEDVEKRRYKPSRFRRSKIIKMRKKEDEVEEEGKSQILLRFGRSSERSPMRFGKRSENQPEIPMPIMRFGKSDPKMNIMRFGRSDPKMNIMRFGRNDPKMNIMRFGRSDPKMNIMRFGRSDPKMNIMRFGRSDPKMNIMRFGRSVDVSEKRIPILRYGRSLETNNNEDQRLRGCSLAESLSEIYKSINSFKCYKLSLDVCLNRNPGNLCTVQDITRKQNVSNQQKNLITYLRYF